MKNLPRLTVDLMGLRVMQEIKDGDVVFPGFGMPMRAIAQYITADSNFTVLSENGVCAHGAIMGQGEAWDTEQTNAGGYPVAILPGTSFFSQLDAFVAIGGRHRVNVSIIGAYQVSEKGDVANWMSPRRSVAHLGGAMDTAAGARKLIVLLEHTTRKGEPRIVKECSAPLTAKGVVDLIITDLAVIQVTPGGLVLAETAPGVTAEDIQGLTEPVLKLSPNLHTMEL